MNTANESKPADPIVTIQITRETALKVIDDIMANFPEASMTLRMDAWSYKDRYFHVWDPEDGKEYEVDETDLLKGFALMFEPGKWPAGLASPPACASYDKKDPKDLWDHWLCNSDAVSFDAFLQLAVLGEVVYG